MNYSVLSTGRSAKPPIPVKTDKSPKKSHRKCVLRDAAFLRDLQALLGPGFEAISSGTSVCGVSTSSSSIPSTSTPITPRPRRTRVQPWWERFLTPSPIRTCSPAEWRDTTDRLRALYAHLALKELGEAHGFSLNLSPEIEAKARLQAKPLQWLHERIAYHLKVQLGREVQFFLIAEEEQRRLHLHGELGVTSNEVALARKALRRAGGEWKSVRQHQAHTRADPDEFWSSYVTKDFWKFGKLMRLILTDHRGWTGTTIRGSVFSQTFLLRQKSANTYRTHQCLVWRHRHGRRGRPQ